MRQILLKMIHYLQSNFKYDVPYTYMRASTDWTHTTSLYYNNITEVSCDIDTFTENFLASPLFHSCVYVIYIIVTILAILGNILVFIVVLSTHNTKIVTNIYIINLATADIMIIIFYVPFSFVSSLVLPYWAFGLLMCKIVNLSQAVSVSVSAYTLLAISIDRFKATIYPLHTRLRKSAAMKTVAVIWISALVTSAPLSVVSELERPSPWYEQCHYDICYKNWSSNEQNIMYTCMMFIIQLFLPLCILAYTYGRMAYTVWTRRLPGEAYNPQDSRMQRSKCKVIKMMVIIVAAFAICWLPFNIFTVLLAFNASNKNWTTRPGIQYVWLACHWLAVSHACYNPIIYCYMNPCYRRDFKQILRRCLCLKLEDSGASHEEVDINTVALQFDRTVRRNRPTTLSLETIAMPDFSQRCDRRKNADECTNFELSLEVINPSSVPNTPPAPIDAVSEL